MKPTIQSNFKTICLVVTLLLPSLLFAQNATLVNNLPLSNMYKIDEGIYRSEQPDAEAFKKLEAFGIKEALNLRYWHNDKNELINTSIKIHNVKMNAHHIEDEDVINALKIIRDRKGPIIFHCKHGSDRTGLICAMYRIVFQNYTKEAAIKELKTGGFGYHKIYFNIPNYIQKVDVEKIKKSIKN